MKLFSKLEIETSSLCNRNCLMCLRNCYPDKTKVASWFTQNLLSDDIVYNLIDQAEKLSFKGELGLSHYNEPLLDERLVKFGQYAKNKNIFSKISFCTNGDLLNENKIEQVDDIFDEVIISRKSEEFKNKFKKTKVLFTNKQYVIKHFDPSKELQQTINKVINLPCKMGQYGMYINHLGNMLMCCSDLIGHFNLGNVKENLIEELWFSKKHQDILLNLEKNNSRSQYVHCSICPLPTKY